LPQLLAQLQRGQLKAVTLPQAVAAQAETSA
jgi:hypothetical protein